MSKDTISGEKREIGARLRFTREALGYGERPEFLRAVYPDYSEVEVTQARQRLEQYERGVAYPSRQFVRDLKRWQGITFEWVFDADMNQLPPRVYEALRKAQRRTA